MTAMASTSMVATCMSFPVAVLMMRTLHIRITLNIICPYGNAAYRFELSVSPGDESAQKMPAVAEPSALKGGE